jgi:hypothetical protein
MKKLLILPILVLVALPTTVAVDESSRPLEPIVSAAISLCSEKAQTPAQVSRLIAARELEKEYDLPNEARGLLLAAICIESRNTLRALGDYRPWVKYYKDGKLKHRQCNPKREKFVDGKRCKPRAYGILQFWPWARKKIRKFLELTNETKHKREPRFAWKASARFYLVKVLKNYRWVLDNCTYTRKDLVRTKKRRYLFKNFTALQISAAEAKAVRPPGKRRCHEHTSHWVRMRNMQELASPIKTIQELVRDHRP